MEVCDLDSDGIDDAVLTAPLAGGDYSGQVAIFFGSGVSGWGSGLGLTDADILITGQPLAFFGYNVRCGDLDGDGFNDLAIANSEVHLESLGIDTDWELDVFYGPASSWPSTLDQTDADAVLADPMDAPSDGGAYGNIIELGDLDGDGALEIVVLFIGGADTFTSGEAHVLAVPGGARLIGTSTLVSESFWTWTPADQDTFDRVRVLDDMDGSGGADVAVFQAGWNGPDTDSGQVMWAGDATGSWVIDLVDVATASLEGQLFGQYFGLTGASGDFDGDGTWDLAVSAYGDETGAWSWPGSVYIYNDAGALGTLGLDASSEANALVLGTEDLGYLGHQLRSAGDADGDGADDLFAVEIQGGTNDQGEIWLFGGALLTGEMNVEDASLLAWEGRNADAGVGREIAVGDLDQDGLPDLVVGAPYADGLAGRTYFLLSSEW